MQRQTSISIGRQYKYGGVGLKGGRCIGPLKNFVSATSINSFNWPSFLQYMIIAVPNKHLWCKEELQTDW